MSSVSSAVRRRASGGRYSSVRMLCSRSASLISSTRTSSAMARRSLRRFSACLASLETRSSFFSLVRPSTSSADLVAEQAVDLGAGGVGILDRVVQQRRRDGGVVELQVGEDRGDFERMREIGIARGPLLLAMGPHGIDIGAVEQVFVGGGIVLFDPVDQVVLPHHRGLRDLAAALRRPAARGSARAPTRTRGRGWFCIRGRSIGERAMMHSVARPLRLSAGFGRDCSQRYHGAPRAPQGARNLGTHLARRRLRRCRSFG